MVWEFQVQRSLEDKSMIIVSYDGHHNHENDSSSPVSTSGRQSSSPPSFSNHDHPPFSTATSAATFSGAQRFCSAGVAQSRSHSFQREQRRRQEKYPSNLKEELWEVKPGLIKKNQYIVESLTKNYSFKLKRARLAQELACHLSLEVGVFTTHPKFMATFVNIYQIYSFPKYCQFH